MDRFITYLLLTVLISSLGGGRVGGAVGDKALETAGPASLMKEDDMQTLQWAQYICQATQITHE